MESSLSSISTAVGGACLCCARVCNLPITIYLRLTWPQCTTSKRMHKVKVIFSFEGQPSRIRAAEGLIRLNYIIRLCLPLSGTARPCLCIDWHGFISSELQQLQFTHTTLCRPAPGHIHCHTSCTRLLGPAPRLEDLPASITAANLSAAAATAHTRVRQTNCSTPSELACQLQD